MSHERNTTRIVESAKAKSAATRDAVMAVIRQMVADGDTVSFYNVQRKTGVSKSFLYNCAEVRDLIERCRRNPDRQVAQVRDERDVQLGTLSARVRELERQIEHYKRDDLWQDRYKRVLAENAELRKRIEASIKW